MFKTISQWWQRCASYILNLPDWKLYAWCYVVVVLSALPTMTMEIFVENWTIHLLLQLLFARLIMIFAQFWLRTNAVMNKLNTLMHMIESASNMEELELCVKEYSNLLHQTMEHHPFIAMFIRPLFATALEFIKDTKDYIEGKGNYGNTE